MVVPGHPRTVRGPDIAFYTMERTPDPLPEGFLDTVPDLPVEIVSPSNTAFGLFEKVAEYLDSGTRLVWIIDPSSRTATVYRSRNDIRMLTDEDTLDGGDVVPGFRVVLGEVLP